MRLGTAGRKRNLNSICLRVSLEAVHSKPQVHKQTVSSVKEGTLRPQTVLSCLLVVERKMKQEGIFMCLGLGCWGALVWLPQATANWQSRTQWAVQSILVQAVFSVQAAHKQLLSNTP